MACATVQLFQFENNRDTFGKLDSITSVTPPLKLMDGKRYYIRGLSAEISARIPNVFTSNDNSYVWNNQIVYVKRNVSDPWQLLTIPAGLYTAQQIGQAIANATSSWYTNITQPAIVISINDVIDVVNIQIDSTKLSAGGTQFCLDLSRSNMHTTLGFSASTILTSDGLFSSTQNPKIDTQTTTLNIFLDLACFRSRNGVASKILFTVPLILANGSLSTFLFPSPGSTLPLIVYTGPRTVTNFTINFRTGNDKPMFWLNGNIIIQFDICEII